MGENTGKAIKKEQKPSKTLSPAFDDPSAPIVTNIKNAIDGTPLKAFDPTKRQLFRKIPFIGLASVGLLAACSPDQGDKNNNAPAYIQKKRKLKMVTAWPKNFPGTGTGAERIAERIRIMSDGALDIRVFASGELVGALGNFDAVAEGKADFYHAAEYYWQGKSPAFNFFAAVPMGLTAGEMAAWIRFGGGQELWDSLSARFGVKPFMAGNTGTQMGGWFTKPVKSPKDFQGLRIRMPGLGGEVMKRMGAASVTKQGGEIFQALSQGNIDATEWIGPWNDLAFGFHTIVKNYYYPGIHEPGTTLSMGMNLALWQDLTSAEKAIIQSAADAENDIMLAEFNANNAKALATLIKDHGVILQRFSDDILKELGRLSIEVLSEAAAHDDFTRQVYESFNAARKEGISWGAVSERAFQSARDLTALS